MNQELLGNTVHQAHADRLLSWQTTQQITMQSNFVQRSSYETTNSDCNGYADFFGYFSHRRKRLFCRECLLDSDRTDVRLAYPKEWHIQG